MNTQLQSNRAVRRVGPQRQSADRPERAERVLSRDELIQSHLGLVVSIAKQYTGRGVAFTDLVAEGNTGLVRAASRFQPERGVRFATYAFPWIEHAVRAACLRQGDVMSVPPGMMRQIYAYRRLLTRMGPGREVSAREVAERLEISVDAAGAVIAASTGLKSATGQGGASGDLDPMKLIPARVEPDPLDHLESEDTASLLAEAMNSLGPRERQVLAMHFGLDGHEPRTRCAIAAELDMLTESVEWALNRALNRLRRLMKQRRVA